VNCTVWGKSSPGKTTVAGVSEQVAICGGLPQISESWPLNPPTGVIVIVDDATSPSFTVSAVGFATNV
jgi:hypothetical protein